MIVKRLYELCIEAIGIVPKYGYKEMFRSDFKMQFHCHSVLEVMYAYDEPFNIELLLDGKSKIRTVSVPPGKFILVNSGIYHRLVITKSPVRILNIEFMAENNTIFGAKLHPLYEYDTEFSTFIKADPDFIVLDGYKKARFLLEQLLTLLIDNNELPHEPPYRNGSVESLLLLQQYTLQFFLLCSKIYSQSSSLKDSRHVYNTVQYINDFLTFEDLSVKNIAAHLHISPAYLSTLFKKHTGINLVAYINKQRVLRAMSFLALSNMSIHDIGIMVGFNSRQHFTRVFKAFAKCSPLEYRQSQAENTIKNYDSDFVYPTEYIHADSMNFEENITPKHNILR